MKLTKITETIKRTINTTIKTSEGKFTVCLATLMAQSAKYIHRKIHNARENL